MEDNSQIHFIELPSVDSTNNYALNLLRQQNLTDRQTAGNINTVVFAHEQWQGKGQRGKKWVSAAGENVQMSVIIHPKSLTIYKQFILSAATALAVREYLSEKTGEAFCIKWPNDLYFQDRKAGGILIENIIAGTEWKWAVAGIGLNVNQTTFDSALPNPVSISQITGMRYDCVALAKELSLKMFSFFTENGILLSTAPDIKEETAEPAAARLFELYNRYLYKRGQIVRLKKGSSIFEAEVIGVDYNGQLIVLHDIEKRFSVGEVEFVR